MGKTTSISWTDSTWNPWRGCHKISAGCANCYMYREQIRYGKEPNLVMRAKPATFNAPLTWKEPAKVFTCSWSDWFIKEADTWRDEAWDIIRQTPHLTYQICTKRPDLIRDRLPADWGNGWRNVWLGVTVERSDYLWRIETLSYIPAYLRWVSYEPSLGPVTFSTYFNVIDWVISGGESGPCFRPANPDWFRDVRDQCTKYDVAYFHKQNGGRTKIDGAWGGKKLDGVVHHAFPQVQA